MSRTVGYLPEVREDFVAAFAYYEALSEGLGERFEAAFKSAEAEVAEGMVTHHRHFGHYHRVVLRHFP
ncbi:hypothetical protein [Actomonas aquatica]|uniref:Uncharacterized protein n=1 Tax=Actomonas aquatica TaxID=2866162 RepID=A0ABZ1C723_9BACT|nr:hypothetical protein [Opitutus sp. WL0086]WRQ87523.1 hypothetical protein K1X11_022130 [Opitutus sp. WL0086]